MGRDEIFAAIALFTAIIIGRAYYKRIMKIGTKKQRFVEKAKKMGCVTTGSYLDSKVLIGDRDSSSFRKSRQKLRVCYQYQVNGKNYKKYIHYVNEGGVGFEFPTEVTFCYDPSNPKKVVNPDDVSEIVQKDSGCLGSIVVAILVTFFVFRLLKFIL